MSMAITYDSKTITLEDPTDFRVRREPSRNVVRADSGESETSVNEYFDEVSLTIESFDSAAIEASLHDWWAWAAAGGTYSVALDSSDVVNTTLSAGATAGDSSVVVASATGITAGARYRIIDADGAYQEVITVADGYSGGTTITLNGTLKRTRVSGAIFRSREYFPSVESLDDEQPWTENPNCTWTLAHAFREAK